MKYLLLFVVLPAVAYAGGILIDVQAGADESEQYVKVSGTNFDIITPKERATFNIGDYSLKTAVSKNFGKRPDDAYVCSPTPWGDLYKTYGWDQVQRFMTPIRGRIARATAQPTVLATQEFTNNSSKTVSFKADVSQKVQNTVSSTWKSSYSFSVTQEIKYEFNIVIVKASTVTKFGYTGTWGKSDTHTESTTIGSHAGVQITLAPGQSAIAELSANRGTMQVDVDYSAYLKGYVAVNYAKTYKGHHFWALPVSGVLRDGGLSNDLTSTETMNIGFYSDAKVTLRDKYSGAVLDVFY